MIAKLFLLFVLMPIVELTLLLQIGSWFGFWPTFALIVVTGVVGSFLAKREGISAWRRLQARLLEGGLPGKELMDGAIILVSGALLVTPGVLTDVVGVMGLLPPTRALMRGFILRRFQKAAARGTAHITFGSFGQATFDPHRERTTPDQEPRWEGRTRDVPGHHRDPLDPDER
jgi:UPF0716 protein FxsA